MRNCAQRVLEFFHLDFILRLEQIAAMKVSHPADVKPVLTLIFDDETCLGQALFSEQRVFH